MSCYYAGCSKMAMVDSRTAEQVLGLAHGVLANWRHLGKGPAFYKIGRRAHYDAGELREWLTKQRRTPTSELAEHRADAA
jgi:hypothetical protein